MTAPLTSYFEHNESWKGARILDALREGRDVALVSDAGTPGISDPGATLVVFGHSHVPYANQHGNALFFNPGAAGKRRFKSVPTCGVLEFTPTGIEHKIVWLDA